MSNSTKKRASLRSLMWVGNGNTIFRIIVPLDDSGDDALILETLDLIGRQSDDLNSSSVNHLNSSSQHLFLVQSSDVVFVKTQLALIYSAVVLPQTRCRSEYRRNAVRKSRKDSRKSHALSQKLGSAPKLAVF